MYCRTNYNNPVSILIGQGHAPVELVYRIVWMLVSTCRVADLQLWASCTINSVNCTVKPLFRKTDPYPILHNIMWIVAIVEVRTECFVIAKTLHYLQIYASLLLQ